MSDEAVQRSDVRQDEIPLLRRGREPVEVLGVHVETARVVDQPQGVNGVLAHPQLVGVREIVETCVRYAMLHVSLVIFVLIEIIHKNQDKNRELKNEHEDKIGAITST